MIPSTSINKHAHHLDLYFGHKVDRVFSASIGFSVPFLASKPSDFGDGKALNTPLCECVPHVIEHVRFDNGRYKFHVPSPRVTDADQIHYLLAIFVFLEVCRLVLIYKTVYKLIIHTKM